MRYTVIAFYPTLPIKKRITEYSRKDEAFEYISGLRFCETPYILFDNKNGKVIDRENYDMQVVEMLEMIQKYC